MSITSKREYTLVIAILLAVAIIFTWPLALHIHDGLPGDNGVYEPTGELGGFGDALHAAWLTAWNAKTIFTHPTDFFQGNIIYPSRDVNTYSEHLFILGVIGSPFYLVTRNPVLTYNVLLYLALVLSAFGTYLLIKEMTGSRWGGLAAGLIFAFCPFRMARPDHLWFLFSPFLPFMLLYLYRYLGGGGRRELLFFGLFFLLQSLSSWHYTMFCLISSVLFLAWTAVFSRGAGEWKRLAFSMAAIAVVLILLIPLLLPYLRTHARLPGFERSESQTIPYSLHAADFLAVLPQSVIYGGAPGPFRHIMAFHGVAPFPGFIAVALFILGLFALRKRRERQGEPGVEVSGEQCLAEVEKGGREEIRDRGKRKGGGLDLSRLAPSYFLILTTVALLLSFGPRFGKYSNPFYNIPYRLGILRFTRTPMRFYLLAVLGIAGLAGFGVSRLACWVRDRLGGKQRARIIALSSLAIILLLLILEMATFNLPVCEVPVWGKVPEVYQILKEQEDVSIVELPSPRMTQGAWTYDGWQLGFVTADPVEYVDHDGLAMYFSTYHWKKTVNGRSSYFPYFYMRIYNELAAFPSRRTVDLLAGLGIDYVIWHWEWLDEPQVEGFRERLYTFPGLRLLEERGEQAILRIEPVDTAGPDELDLRLQSPSSAPEREQLNLGLLLRNPTSKPFVMAVEDAQPFMVNMVGQGQEYEVRGDYRVPLYLAPGEETSVPLVLKRTPPAGDYRLELSIDEGVFAPFSASLPVTFRTMEEMVGSGVLNGAVGLPGGSEELRIQTLNGLYPVTLEVENTGQNYWMAYWDAGRAEDYPYGLVRVLLGWMQDDQWVWDHHYSFLPCDLAPGQKAQVPILVRPPDQPGDYILTCVLFDQQLGQLSEISSLKVSMGGEEEGSIP